MDSKTKLTGHAQVKPDKNGRTRSYYAFWRDANGKKHGGRIGAAHVRDTGRRTPRSAVIWRAGDGPKPTAQHLTPREAEAKVQEILRQAEASADTSRPAQAQPVLHEATEGWLSARHAERGLKRSTVADYEDLFERLYRDLGAETPIHELADGRLRSYFAEFKAERLLGEQAAAKALSEGKDVAQVQVERWTAQPPGSQAVEVSTRREAVRLAAQIGGTWKHRRRGCYRIVSHGAQRPRGKSCLLVHFHRKIATENRIKTIYIDADEIKRLGYPDILIRLLLTITEELPGSRSTPIRRLFRRSTPLERQAKELRGLLDLAEQADVSWQQGYSRTTTSSRVSEWHYSRKT
jgi:hypothetical protein